MPSLSWLSGVPTKLLIFRVLGVLISIVGGILVIGNRSGQILTFPFAGTIVVVVGVLVFYFLGKVDPD
jgi:glucose uptake protein GlcU